MLRAYTPIPGHEGVTGTVITGTDAGSIDLAEELAKGNGKIVTENGELQSVLENLYGTEGLVFSVAQIEEDGTQTPIEFNIAPPQLSPSGMLPPAPPAPVVEHPDSEYVSLTLPELQEVVMERKLKVDLKAATQAELIAALEASDAEGVH